MAKQALPSNIAHISPEDFNLTGFNEYVRRVRIAIYINLANYLDGLHQVRLISSYYDDLMKEDNRASLDWLSKCLFLANLLSYFKNELAMEATTIAEAYFFEDAEMIGSMIDEIGRHSQVNTRGNGLLAALITATKGKVEYKLGQKMLELFAERIGLKINDKRAFERAIQQPKAGLRQKLAKDAIEEYKARYKT